MGSDIRLARRSDAAAVSGVILAALRESNARDYSAEVIARVETSFGPAAVERLIEQRQVYVALLEGRILGTASLDGAVVRSVFVAPEAQGRGIGRALMAEVERAARAAGVRSLAVPASITAESFYAGLGFETVETRYHGEERTLVMRRDLAPL
ncbi:GNAT family N-acetyltransferase [Pseudomonas sp. RIT-PI-AD]|uniref:GNAT family N-acetyltransferase n=1 Tax=Pseudomonas sp. RIT-PI-AD TaxID=3035294 RepID=UPI0021DB7842|nr:GNAT family N-acetyltransferase [Pseudomonas sp. RIT-PI-AD]